MTFNWSEYLSLARQLARQAPFAAAREARLRSAVSRAYYSVYCLARNRLVSEGHVIPRDVNPHTYVIDQFRNSPDTKRGQLGLNLDRLRTDRNKADYFNSFQGLELTTPLDIALAEQALQALSSLANL